LVDDQIVPCGRCIGCRAEQSRQWAVRMMHEARMHESNCFITLTYDQENLPENASLRPQDLSGFIKNLRKTQSRRISFFGCGEYDMALQSNSTPHKIAVHFILGVRPIRTSSESLSRSSATHSLSPHFDTPHQIT
jgi:uncharacterized protein YcbK (DUF882 family)